MTKLNESDLNFLLEESHHKQSAVLEYIKEYGFDTTEKKIYNRLSDPLLDSQELKEYFMNMLKFMRTNQLMLTMFELKYNQGNSNETKSLLQ